MPNGLELIDQRNHLIDLLNSAIAAFGRRGQDYAEADRNYRIALASKMLELRADKQPVTLVPDLARGDANVAALKFDRDTKESLYKAAQEAIQGYKLQIRIAEAEIEREWGKNTCM